jgi:hypothetical protein
VETWDRATRRAVRRHTRALLKGVGGKIAVEEQGERALHLKKYALPHEAAAVGGVIDVRGTDYEPIVLGATW